MGDELRKKIEQILKEPDIGCMNWGLGHNILANWKAGLAPQLLALFDEEEIRKQAKLEGYEEGFSDGQVYSFTANKTIEAIKQEAKKEGIREVVEWIQNHGGGLDGNRVEWQAKLKELGIEP